MDLNADAVIFARYDAESVRLEQRDDDIARSRLGILHGIGHKT